MSSITPDLVRLYADSDALGLAELVHRREVSAPELVEVAISVIAAFNPKLNAVSVKTFEIARAMAGVPSDGPFGGVPFLLKDIGSMWQGSRMTAGLGYRKDFICSYDSEMVKRIKTAGFAILGRTNVPENGWCIATEPRLHGPTLNPWNPDVTPGGRAAVRPRRWRRAWCRSRRGPMAVGRSACRRPAADW